MSLEEKNVIDSYSFKIASLSEVGLSLALALAVGTAPSSLSPWHRSVQEVSQLPPEAAW